MKTCRVCKKVKEIEQFYFYNNKFRSQCKQCDILRSTNWKKNNYQRVREIKSKWKKNNPNKIRNEKLQYKYGITNEIYDKMFNLQNGCCKICSKSQSEFKKKLAVDHCHITGKIRGLLCDKCNKGLGHFDDSTEILEKAKNYLLDLK